MTNKLATGWLFALLLFWALPSWAVEEIRIGIRAYRAKPIVQAQWAPLATALNAGIPEFHFSVEAFAPEELEAAVAARQIEFILTNPSQYLLIRNRSGLSAPLATLETLERGRAVSAYGGVIFRRTDRKDIQTLKDVKGKSVATAGIQHFGAHQIQAHEFFLAGINLLKDVNLIVTGMPLDNVVNAVLNGQADVGMVRSGLLEILADEGKLDASQLTVLNQQDLPEFPAKVSTRLYPEWPFAALPQTKKQLKRKVAAFLLNIEENPALGKALQIHGFQVPSSYDSVEMVLRELHVPPFDIAPEFTLRDIWQRFQGEILAGLVMAALTLVLGINLILANRRLKIEQNIVKKQTDKIEESEQRWKFALEGSGDGVWDVDFARHTTLYSQQFKTLLGYREDEFNISFSEWPTLLHPEDKQRVEDALQTFFGSQDRHSAIEYRMRCKDGSYKWFNARCMIVSRSADGKPLRLVGTHTDITHSKNAEAVVWKQANYDSLTQLPNRRLFQDRLSREISRGQRDATHTALLFIDLDRFKEVNDTLGHDMGDILLVEASSRIKKCVRDSDTVARLGGDEFTVILCDLQDPSYVGRVAQNIIDSLSAPFMLKAQEAFISASIGIALHPEDSGNLTDLLKNADQAMYAAKENGRGCYHFFTKAMQDTSELRMNLSRDLRHALEKDQFLLHFQPIVDIHTRQIRKAEALIRWQHPQHGLLPPCDFITIAEENGTIQAIGDWVFRQAAQQALNWSRSSGHEFQVSINVSLVQFSGTDTMQTTWIEHLAELGLPGHCIAVEITEKTVMGEDKRINEALLKFCAAGIQVAIDDFGTGYSSLSYLKKFDVDYLKIEQSFIQNLAPANLDATLCETIIVMAHKLGLQVIAEGVESPSQLELLTQMGCDFAQGYHLSRPMTAEDFSQFLSAAETPQ